MFNKRKRALAMLAAIVLPVLAALWTAFLSKLTTPKSGASQTLLQHYLPFMYVGLICMIAGVAAYFTHLKPAIDLEKPLLQFLDVLADKPIGFGNTYGIRPRMNIMVATRPWYLIGKKRLRVVWGKNMRSYPDVRFVCRSDQGVCGRAFLARKVVLAGCSTGNRSSFNFSKQQQVATAHVTAVWSWPIYEINSKGIQTGKVLGVVNLDATNTGAVRQIAMHSAGAFERSMIDFTQVVSTIV